MLESTDCSPNKKGKEFPWRRERKNREHLVLPHLPPPFDFVGINTPSSYQQGIIPEGEEPPFGLLRVVVAAAERHRFKAGILDAHCLNMDLGKIAEQLEKTRPKLVGINPTSVNVPEGQQIAQICREMSIPYVVGGVHASLDVKEARENFPDGIIVKGDGEEAIGEVINWVMGNGERKLSGIYYPDQPIGTRTDQTPRIPIEDLPFINQSDYVERPIHSHPVMINGKGEIINEASLYCTRGCPFNCAFCASPVMVGRGVKGIRPYDHPGMGRVVDEVDYLVRLGADAVHFLDDMAIVTPKQVLEFWRLVQERKLAGRFIWRGMTRAPIVAKRFNEEVLEALVNSGCWKLALGVESGNNDVLRMINKGITTDDVIEAVIKLTGAGIQTKAFIIMGFPGETWEQMLDTYNFVMHLKSLGLTDVSVFQFKPYPGTMLYEKIKKENPQVLKRLNFLGPAQVDNSSMGQRAIQGVWLPPDLMIADGVPSGKVQELVMRTIEDFYN